MASSVTVQPAGQGTSAGGRGRQNTTLLKQSNGGWREEATITFAREVTTVSLLQLHEPLRVDEILGSTGATRLNMLLTVMSLHTCRLL
jgi:hypothetical protein